MKVPSSTSRAGKPPRLPSVGSFDTMITTFYSLLKKLLFIFQYIIYEVIYYIIGGEAIIHDLIYKSKNKCGKYFLNLDLDKDTSHFSVQMINKNSNNSRSI